MGNTISKAYAEELRVKGRFYEDFPLQEGEDERRLMSCFKGYNFMTSDVIGYTESPNGYAVEVSCGRGFAGDILFGVTFATLEGERLKEGEDPSDCCHSYDEVKELIKRN